MASILVVEDTAAIRNVIEDTLQRAGHQVTVATDGAQALLLLKTSSFDLMITDVVMPEVDGLEVLRAVRRMTAPPRVIAISGGGRGSGTDYLEIARLFGAAATLEKPFGGEQLTAVINDLLKVY